MTQPRTSKVVAAAAIVGVLGIGGVSFAAAQDDSPTTPAPAPSTTVDRGTAPDRGDENCPDHGAGSRGADPGTAPDEEDPADISSV